jgi:hypothetical protein
MGHKNCGLIIVGKITLMDDVDEAVFWIILVAGFFLFIILTALVRASAAREHLKKHPVKKCPFCAEIVKLEAKVCKHCGRDFEPVASQPAPERPPKDGTIEEYERWKKSQGL